MVEIIQKQNVNTTNVNRAAIEQLLDYLTNAHMPFAQTMRFK
jgi:hypothetical protein